MGPTWPFLLMFESRVERHSFCGIETLNDYMYSTGWWIVNGTPGWGVTHDANKAQFDSVTASASNLNSMCGQLTQH